MREAADYHWGGIVDAAKAVPGRKFVCACCDAPVHLVKSKTLYFAHERYRARPDCELYCPSTYQYTGRPTRPSGSQKFDRDETGYIGFEMTPEGPCLAVYLPPATNVPLTGELEVACSSLTYEISLRHLHIGKRIHFRLNDGQWSVTTRGDVAEEYAARLALGRQSLELERNLFSASASTGRRIEPFEPIRLGDTLWWIARSALGPPPPFLADGSVELICEEKGWFVHLVTLPLAANAGQVEALARWMQRRLQPRRPRMWIESPWPRQTRYDGVPVYCMSDGPILWRSDQSVDLRVFNRTGDETYISQDGVTSIDWVPPEPGEFVIEADGFRQPIQVVKLAPRPAAGALAVVDEQTSIDLTELQGEVAAAARAGRQHLAARISWKHVALRPRVNCNARNLAITGYQCELVLQPGDYFSLDKLGTVQWERTPPVESLKDSKKQLLHEPLIRWLASVGKESQDAGRLRVFIPSSLATRHAILTRLSRLSWEHSLAAQVSTVARAIVEMQ